MVDGYGDKRVAWEEKKKEKEKEKEMVLYRREPLVVNDLARKRQETENGGHHVNIFTKMPS